MHSSTIAIFSLLKDPAYKANLHLENSNGSFSYLHIYYKMHYGQLYIKTVYCFHYSWTLALKHKQFLCISVFLA